MDGSKLPSLLLILCLSFGFYGHAHAGDLWWAVALGYSNSEPVVYGASWNYPTRDEAKKQALQECMKRKRKESNLRCYVRKFDKNSCFFISTWIVHRFYISIDPSTNKSKKYEWDVRCYGVGGPFPSMDALKATAQKSMLNNPDTKIYSKYQVILTKCSGAK